VIQAFREAEISEQPQIYWGDYSPELAYERAKQALAVVPRPTAIFAASDVLLMGVMRALREAKLRVPEDVSVVAFDDIPPSILVEPFFTVAVQPTYEMGRQAVDLLLARLGTQRPDKFRDIILPVEVIIRKSSGKPAAMKAKD
jgi:DNA-binding LacI/PurR family transcriptional regulator